LMKHALQQQGSRDVSAQLFTALCRALGIPARLVVSLQSVPWQSSIGKLKSPSKKGKKKAPSATLDDHTDNSTGAEGASAAQKSRHRKTAFPGGGQRLDGGETDQSSVHEAPSHIKLRKSRPAGRTLGSPSHNSRELPPDPLTTPPVFWTEVFSRADGKWIPVDPIRAIVNKRKLFDPAEKPQTGPGPRFKKENRMIYVIALEEDGYGRDVTPRYAKEYGAKVAKLQQGGANKNRKEWWDRITAIIRRPYQLVR
jgi:xeroderma pigmentosum group C-complementing protein